MSVSSSQAANVELLCHKNITLPLSSNGASRACGGNLVNKCPHLQTEKELDKLHNVKQSLDHIHTPPKSSSKDLTRYFTVTGNTPTSVGVVDVYSSTLHRPAKKKRKRVRRNLGSLMDTVGPSPKKIHDFFQSHSGQEILCSSSTRTPVVVTSLSYNSNSKHHSVNCKRKVESCKTTPNSKRHCQTNKLTNYFGSTTPTKLNPVDSYSDVKNKTAPYPMRFSNGSKCNISPGINSTKSNVLSKPLDVKMAHSDDASLRRKPLKERKNIVSTMQYNGPAQVCTSSQPIRPPSPRKAIFMIDSMKKFYTYPNSFNRKKMKNAMQAYTNGDKVPILNSEIISLSSDDECDLGTTSFNPDGDMNLQKEQQCTKDGYSPLSKWHIGPPVIVEMIDLTEGLINCTSLSRQTEHSGKNGISTTTTKEGFVVDLTEVEVSWCNDKSKTTQESNKTSHSARTSDVIDLTDDLMVSNNADCFENGKEKVHCDQLRLEKDIDQFVPLRNQSSVVELTESIMSDVGLGAATKSCDKKPLVDIQGNDSRLASVDLTSSQDFENGYCVKKDLSSRPMSPTKEVLAIDTGKASPSYCGKSEIIHSKEGVVTQMLDEETSDASITVTSNISLTNSKSTSSVLPESLSPRPTLKVHDSPGNLPQTSQHEHDTSNVINHVVQQIEEYRPLPVVQQDCSLINSVSLAVQRNESSVGTVSKSNCAEDTNPLLVHCLVQSGVPLGVCEKFSDGEGIHKRTALPLPRRANWLLGNKLDTISSVVLKDIATLNAVLNSTDTPHSSAKPVKDCVNSNTCKDTGSVNIKATSEGDLRTLPRSVRLCSSLDSVSNSTNDVSSTASEVNLPVSSSSSSSSAMSTSQLISYINEVVDNYNDTPAKRLRLMTPNCLRASTPCQHVNYLQVSDNFIKWDSFKIRYELYSMHLSSCTKVCSRDRYLDIETLQGIVQFILNESDPKLAVEAVNTFSSLVNGWPPCTMAAHTYYKEFLINPYQYILAKQGLWEMVCEKLESFIIEKPAESFRDNNFLYSSFESSDEDVGEKKVAQVTNWLELCGTFAAEDHKSHKTYICLSSEEQRHRLAAVVDVVVHILEQDFIVYLMGKKKDSLRGLTSPSKQPLVVKMVWFGQSIRGIGTVTTMCRRIIKLYLTSTGKLRHILARLLSLMGEIVLYSELQRHSHPYFGSKCKEFAREIVNMVPAGMNIVDDVANELKPSWLSLAIIHHRTCQVLGTEGSVSLDIVVSCMEYLTHPPKLQDQAAEKASKVNRKNANGEVRLHVVCRNKRLDELLTLLSDPSVDVNVKDNAGWTPLHEAVSSGSTKCVKLLLDYKPKTGGQTVDASARGLSGHTPLMDAVLQGSADMCEMLLKYAGWYLLEDKNDCGLNPVDVAKDLNVLKVLKSAKKKYPYRTGVNRCTISTSTITQENLPEITRLIPAYVRWFFNAYQMQEIMDLARANTPIQSETRGDFNYLEYFYGLKNMRKIKKLVKLAKKNSKLDPLIGKAFEINHPLIAL